MLAARLMGYLVLGHTYTFVKLTLCVVTITTVYSHYLHITQFSSLGLLGTYQQVRFYRPILIKAKLAFYRKSLIIILNRSDIQIVVPKPW